MPPVLANIASRSALSGVLRPVAASSAGCSAPTGVARPRSQAVQVAAVSSVSTREDVQASIKVAETLVEPEVGANVLGEEPSTSEVSQPGNSVAGSVASFSTRSSFKGADHNSVTIKGDTKVKDAAGAIVKVLNRISNTFVTALRLEASHEALNRAVKSIAVARKYIADQNEGAELTFLPLNRSDKNGVTDPNRFAFLVFKITKPTTALLEHDETDLNVSRSSDPNAIANAIIRIVMERGQAVMKAGGSDAMWVAMTAVVNARRRMKARFQSDVQLVPAWITEDTSATLGRESKFIRFNILPCAVNGPETAAPVHPAAASGPAV